MHSFLRTLLFAFFVALFLLGAPAVVLYTAGYRYNPTNGSLVRTGVLAVSSSPRGATITLNGDLTEETTPVIFNRIIPGNYRVLFSKEGYHSVYRDISVESGKTTYLNDAYLFADAAPVLMQEESAEATAVAPNESAIAIARRTGNDVEVWVYNGNATDPYELLAQASIPAHTPIALAWSGDRSSITLNGALITQDDVPAAVTLVDNGQAIEVHAGTTTVAFLPSGTYALAEVTGSIAVVHDTDHDMLYLLDVASDDPILLTAHGTRYDWNEHLERFVWTDGIELNAFDVASRATKFITRQSEPIIAAAWHPSGQAIFAATATALNAFTFEDGIVQATIPLAAFDISAFWHDATGKYVYLYGTKEGTEGIYRLQVK